ncbi:hypothetical protein [Phormidesmis priestleyi]
MVASDYSNPVAQLLTSGECAAWKPQSWIDYPALGITVERFRGSPYPQRSGVGTDSAARKHPLSDATQSDASNWGG